MHGSGPGGGRIIPYFYRAQGEIREEDITITTLVTGNRFGVFERLVRSYDGAFLLSSSDVRGRVC